MLIRAETEMPITKKLTEDAMEFLAMVSHDMKTPVSAQMRAVKLLSSGALGEFSEDVQNIFLNIEASNKYMQCLLDNVLSSYRLNKGDLILNKTKNDIRKTIEEALKNAGILFAAKNQTVSVNYMANNYIKEYDEIEIQRVLINMLSNAFEHSSENSTVKLVVTSKLNKIKIEISNQKSLTSSIHAPVVLNPLKAGLGLGLVICEKIISAHGGTLKSETCLNGEYKINFTLP